MLDGNVDESMAKACRLAGDCFQMSVWRRLPLGVHTRRDENENEGGQLSFEKHDTSKGERAEGDGGPVFD